MMKVYAYCLSDEIADDAFEGLAGVGGGTPRLLRRGGVAAVVSDFGGDAATITRENVLAHESVVGAVLARVTPLPFRFGTVIGEEALAAWVTSRESELKGQLARVRGCVEMSVRVIWKPRAGESVGQSERTPEAHGPGAHGDQSSSELSSPGVSPSPSESSAGAGTAFLLAKRREIEGDEARASAARGMAEWLACALACEARDSRVEVHTRGALVVSAAYLVERARLAEYRERLRAAQESRRDLHFLTSGAWPPYSFTSAPEARPGANC